MDVQYRYENLWSLNRQINEPMNAFYKKSCFIFVSNLFSVVNLKGQKSGQIWTGILEAGPSKNWEHNRREAA